MHTSSQKQRWTKVSLTNDIVTPKKQTNKQTKNQPNKQKTKQNKQAKNSFKNSLIHIKLLIYEW